MPQTQVCSQGHRWDPSADDRPDLRTRWQACPVCGGSVAMVSVRDTDNGVSNAPTTNGPSPALPSPPTDPGIPGYEVLAVLGYGGIGVVYKARHGNRLVALKMVSA